MGGVEDICEVVTDKSTGTGESAVIVLQSKRSPTEGGLAITELQSNEVRKYALQVAVALFGLATPGISNSLRPYPVDSEGNPLVDATGMPRFDKPVAAWQVAVPVTARLV